MKKDNFGQDSLIAFTGFDLNKIKKEFEGISGSWNGEDSWYPHEGNMYHEDQAHCAEEIVETINKLQELFKEWNS